VIGGRPPSRSRAAGPGRVGGPVRGRLLHPGEALPQQRHVVGVLALHLRGSATHRGVGRGAGQHPVAGLGARLGAQRELHGMPRLPRVVHRVARHRLRSLEERPAEATGSQRRNLRPAHVRDALRGPPTLVMGHVEKQCCHVRVAVHLHRVGQFGVALDALALHRRCLQQQVFQRAWRAHASNCLSNSSRCVRMCCAYRRRALAAMVVDCGGGPGRTRAICSGQSRGWRCAGSPATPGDADRERIHAVCLLACKESEYTAMTAAGLCIRSRFCYGNMRRMHEIGIPVPVYLYCTCPGKCCGSPHTEEDKQMSVHTSCWRSTPALAPMRGIVPAAPQSRP
jgi:hypothetical protein